MTRRKAVFSRFEAAKWHLFSGGHRRYHRQPMPFRQVVRLSRWRNLREQRVARFIAMEP